QSWVVTTRGCSVGAARNIRRRRNLFPFASSHVDEVRSSDVLGPRASRPPMSPYNQDHSSQTHWHSRRAGGTPAVPANHLTVLLKRKGRKPFDLLPTASCLLPTGL